MSAAAAPFALQVRGLARRFGARVALHPLDFELARGRTLAVLGPNGAGKSTLLRMLAGLMRPSAGAFSLGAGARDRVRARSLVGFAGHENFSYAALSVRENLELAARLYGCGDARARVTRALRELGLAGVADRRVAQLSHGLARRLGIARALLHEPQLLLLDEPFSGLDPRAATRLAQHLARFCHGATTPRATNGTPAPREARETHETAAPRVASEARETSTPHDTQTAHTRACVLVTHEPARVVELAQHALVLVRGRARVLPSAALADVDALLRAYHDAVGVLEGAA